MIRKLILIGKNAMRSTLIAELSTETSISFPEPRLTGPAAWAEEAGFTHYAYILEMKLKQWQKLQVVLARNLKWNCLDIGDKTDAALTEDDLKKSLLGVGFKVHASAEEDDA